MQDWAEFAQLQDWLARVNARPRRVLGCAPTDRITGMAINPDLKRRRSRASPDCVGGPASKETTGLSFGVRANSEVVSGDRHGAGHRPYFHSRYGREIWHSHDQRAISVSHASPKFGHSRVLTIRPGIRVHGGVRCTHHVHGVLRTS